MSDATDIEILSIDRWKRKIVIRKPPQSMRALITALRLHWIENEMPFPLAEVVRTEKPSHLFYSVHWIDRSHLG